jgi:hypothetical protein
MESAPLHKAAYCSGFDPFVIHITFMRMLPDFNIDSPGLHQ